MPEVQQANGGGYRSSSSSAERVRRYRLRQRQGRLVVSVEIEQADIDVLVHREYLSQANRGDPAAIHDALYKFTSDAFWEARLADEQQARERAAKRGSPARVLPA
jgi:hypothetical protein